MQSLLFRYFFLNSQHSSVRIDKVLFPGRPWCAGLAAVRSIDPATTIASTCSSMSADIWDPEHGALSVIECSPSQLGIRGGRLILGPFRFVNHDCNPNSQVSKLMMVAFELCSWVPSQIIPLRNTHAYAICALKHIMPGEAITTCYTGTGYREYAKEGKNCGCATCNPNDAPIRQLSQFIGLPTEAEADSRPNPLLEGGRRSLSDTSGDIKTQRVGRAAAISSHVNPPLRPMSFNPGESYSAVVAGGTMSSDVTAQLSSQSGCG